MIAKRSNQDCKFPNQHKTTHVSCINKKGNTQAFSNYHPISLFSIPRKLLESAACSQLDSFFNDFNLTSTLQWGLSREKLTELLLLDISEN